MPDDFLLDNDFLESLKSHNPDTYARVMADRRLTVSKPMPVTKCQCKFTCIECERSCKLRCQGELGEHGAIVLYDVPYPSDCPCKTLGRRIVGLSNVMDASSCSSAKLI